MEQINVSLYVFICLFIVMVIYLSITLSNILNSEQGIKKEKRRHEIDCQNSYYFNDNLIIEYKKVD